MAKKEDQHIGDLHQATDDGVDRTRQSHLTREAIGGREVEAESHALFSADGVAVGHLQEALIAVERNEALRGNATGGAEAGAHLLGKSSKEGNTALLRSRPRSLLAQSKRK